MNHDYAHCLDYTKDCPGDCFRAQLQKDIEENRSKFIGVPMTYAHLVGTGECKLEKDTNVPNKVWTGEWILVRERLPKNDDWAIVTILDEWGDTPWTYTDFGWYLEAANCWIIDAQQRTDVVAWMPLPEPYKEDKDDNRKSDRNPLRYESRI